MRIFGPKKGSNRRGIFGTTSGSKKRRIFGPKREAVTEGGGRREYLDLRETMEEVE
jgi:hypothetical protein